MKASMMKTNLKLKQIVTIIYITMIKIANAILPPSFKSINKLITINLKIRRKNYALFIKIKIILLAFYFKMKIF